MGKLFKYNVEQKKIDIKDNILCDCFYRKLKKRKQNHFMGLKIKTAVTLGGV